MFSYILNAQWEWNSSILLRLYRLSVCLSVCRGSGDAASVATGKSFVLESALLCLFPPPVDPNLPPSLFLSPDSFDDSHVIRQTHVCEDYGEKRAVLSSWSCGNCFDVCSMTLWGSLCWTMCCGWDGISSRTDKRNILQFFCSSYLKVTLYEVIMSLKCCQGYVIWASQTISTHKHYPHIPLTRVGYAVKWLLNVMYTADVPVTRMISVHYSPARGWQTM